MNEENTGLDQDNSAEIEKIIAPDNDNTDKIQDLEKKNRQLRREELC